MRESQVEKRLCLRVAQLGGVAEKFVSPGRKNVPDRIILLPDGIAEFVECKATGKKPTKGQLRDHERRRRMGFAVYVVDSYEAIDELYPL